MKKTGRAIILCAIVSLLPFASQPAEAGIIKSIVLYLPNRVFDVLDIVRLRLRIGPGLSAGVSATEAADVFIGSHTSIYAGLRGSRGKPQIPWPCGVENRSGAELSVIDETQSNVYSDPLGCGAQAQVGIIGLNVMFNLYDMLDLLTGFALIDIAKDDF